MILPFIATLLALDDISQQVAPSPLIVLLASSVLIVSAVVWILHLFFVKQTAPSTGRSIMKEWRWYILPFLLMAVISAMIFQWPMLLRFRFSREAFEQKVAEMAKKAPITEGPQRIGWYWVDAVFARTNGYVGFETGASIIDPVGFSWDPTRPQTHPYNKHIVGNWYASEW